MFYPTAKIASCLQAHNQGIEGFQFSMTEMPLGSFKKSWNLHEASNSQGSKGPLGAQVGSRGLQNLFVLHAKENKSQKKNTL